MHAPQLGSRLFCWLFTEGNIHEVRPSNPFPVQCTVVLACLKLETTGTTSCTWYCTWYCGVEGDAWVPPHGLASTVHWYLYLVLVLRLHLKQNNRDDGTVLPVQKNSCGDITSALPVKRTCMHVYIRM